MLEEESKSEEHNESEESKSEEHNESEENNTNLTDEELIVQNNLKEENTIFNFKSVLLFIIVIVSISGIYILTNQNSQQVEIEDGNSSDIVEALKLGEEIGCTNTHFDFESGRLPCDNKETYLEMLNKYEKNQLTNRLYLVILIFLLLFSILLLYINRQSKQYRSIEINGEKYLMPTEWKSLITELTNITASNDEILRRVYSVNTELPENFSDLQQTFLQLQKKLNSQDHEIERLKKGYDNHITKKIINRFIRVLTYIEELKEKNPEDSKLDNLKLLMEDSLAQCNVSEYAPKVGSEYREAEGVDQNIEVIETTDPSLNFQIAKVLKKGFKISYDEHTDYIQNSVVAVYKFTEEE